jgi:pimeloyl-ACP methyl ester carboxylesterase
MPLIKKLIRVSWPFAAICLRIIDNGLAAADVRPTSPPAAPGLFQSHIQFVTVEKDVQLEVIDWGGSGRSLVLLAGLGGTAHAFDTFARKLIASYHVYGITRRGFGASSVPTSGYEADRLGDDVLAVIDALKLNRPILVGHSLGGEELSSVGSRHPEKIAGLIYLEAAYPYAYYDPSRGQAIEDLLDAMREIPRKMQMLSPTLLPQSFLETSAPVQAILAGRQKYTKLPIPILAIFAVPHELGPDLPNEPTALAIMEAYDAEVTEAQSTVFEEGVPSARVVRLSHASHAIFISNEADVLREMNAFLAGLP